MNYLSLNDYPSCILDDGIEHQFFRYYGQCFRLSLTRTKPSLFYIFIKYDVLLYSNMTTLVTTPDIDCRKFKKDYGNSVKNQHDWRDWLDQHQLEYKYHNIIRKDYLHHYHPIKSIQSI